MKEPATVEIISAQLSTFKPSSLALMSLIVAFVKRTSEPHSRSARRQRLVMTGAQINTVQQTNSAIAFIFVITCEGRVHAGLGW
jgi:hypothetical protein